MKQRMFLLLQYLLVVVVILGSLFLIHKNVLKGRTILLPGKEIEAIVIDSKDRVWVATTWDGVVMYEAIKSTSFDSIGDSTWITTIGVDESDQVWVIAGAGVLAAYSPATIYKFNGSDWVATRQTTGRPDKNDLPCCLPNDETIVSSQIFDEYSAFLEIANQISNFDRPRFLKDEQGNMWAGTDSGLVHFSSDFKIPPPPLKALHIFLSSGGYWILGVIITIVFYDYANKLKFAKRTKTFFISNGSAPLIFSLASIICIMAGWLIGTNLGRFNPETWVDTSFLPLAIDASSQAAGQGGISGGIWGLIIGSFLGFGGFGLTTAWTWRKKYSNMSLRHSLLLVLGWLFIPVVMLILMAWSFL